MKMTLIEFNGHLGIVALIAYVLCIVVGYTWGWLDDRYGNEHFDEEFPDDSVI